MEKEKMIEMSNVIVDIQVAIANVQERFPNSREKSLTITKLEEAEMWVQRALQREFYKEEVKIEL